ncbi:MAG: ATP-binding protein [Bacteroidia bacterium]|nr:ATP-binding protein [Bacteroidia bacterium]
MITRSLTDDIIKYLNHFPAVAIIGPRQAGKTTLAKYIATKIKKESTYLDLERMEDLIKLNNPAAYLEKRKDECVILDEIQRRPELFPEMRSLIDRHRIPGRFLILGSAGPALMRQSSESLAGRIVYVELTPFTITEIGEKDIENLWIRGGFPESFLCRDEKARSKWQNSFISTYIERDLPMLGLITSTLQLSTFFRMVSGIQGNILNVQALSRSLGVTATTINRYLDYLEKSFLIRRLSPFYMNIKKRLVKSPKIYLRDTGILHSLLGISSARQLWDNINIGVSWESFVIEQVIAIMDKDMQAWFYRTHEGTECDLLLTRADKPVASIEIKISLVPKRTKSMTHSIKDLKTEQNFIIVPRCDESFKISENITVCRLKDFVDNYLPKI